MEPNDLRILQEPKSRLEKMLTEFDPYFIAPWDRRIVAGILGKVRGEIEHSQPVDYMMSENDPLLEKIVAHARRFRETGKVEYEVAGRWLTEEEVREAAKDMLSGPYVYASMLPRLRQIAAGNKPKGNDYWPSALILSLEQAVKAKNEILEKERMGYVISGLAFADDTTQDVAYRLINYADHGKRTAAWPTEEMLWAVREKYSGADGRVNFSPLFEQLKTEKFTGRSGPKDYERVAEVVAEYLTRV